jgi:hypothetical protein
MDTNYSVTAAHQVGLPFTGRRGTSFTAQRYYSQLQRSAVLLDFVHDDRHRHDLQKGIDQKIGIKTVTALRHLAQELLGVGAAVLDEVKHAGVVSGKELVRGGHSKSLKNSQKKLGEGLL